MSLEGLTKKLDTLQKRRDELEEAIRGLDYQIKVTKESVAHRRRLDEIAQQAEQDGVPRRAPRRYRDVDTLILNYIREHPWCSSTEVCRALDVSSASVLRKIMDGKIVRQGERGAYKLYVPS